MSQFRTMWRALNKAETVQKPGDAKHSPKWDRCVEHVKEGGKGADPYAVCSAMLGDESFKSMSDKEFFPMLDKAMGIAFAGGVPNSLLARQDLEGSTSKGAVEAAGKKIDTVARKAGSAEETTEKEGIISGMKSAQKDRQKAVLSARGKSFKEYWKGDFNKVERGLYEYRKEPDGTFSVVCSDNQKVSGNFESMDEALAHAKKLNEQK